MATLSEIEHDVKFLQRLISSSGFPCGTIDGIRGKKTNEAFLKFKEAHFTESFLKLDERSKNNLLTVNPKLSDKAAKLILKLNDIESKTSDAVWKVIIGTRSYSEQNSLYNQGRTTKGPRVTNAKAGQSYHNFGIAIDLCRFTGKYADYNDSHYMIIKDPANELDLDWGGNWTSFKDYPHIQLLSGSTSKFREMFESGKPF